MSDNYLKDSQKWTIDWLISCQQHHELPWEFDFKRWFLNNPYQNKFHSDPLKLQLAYKFNLLPNTVYFPDNSYTSFNERINDVDKIAFPIYRVLDWQVSPKDRVRGDAINSFKTTFTPMLSIYHSPFAEKNKQVWKQFYPDIPYLDTELTRWGQGTALINFKYFPAYQENQDRLASGQTNINLFIELSRFASLTGTIGNFVVTDYEENKNRSSFDHDYWDSSLQRWRSNYSSEEWQIFIDNYDLKGYVHADYSVGLLWDNHQKKDGHSYPQTIADFEQFYQRANQLITARGQLMTKQLIEKLGFADKLSFYKEYGLNEDLNNRYYDTITSN